MEYLQIEECKGLQRQGELRQDYTGDQGRSKLVGCAAAAGAKHLAGLVVQPNSV